MEGDPERKSWLLTHSVWKQIGGEKNRGDKKTHTRTQRKKRMLFGRQSHRNGHIRFRHFVQGLGIPKGA